MPVRGKKVHGSAPCFPSCLSNLRVHSGAWGGGFVGGVPQENLVYDWFVHTVLSANNKNERN